ncbi:glycosyltransferase family 4 protein [Vaginisenegalia massiliensis]|uniref:glycosyltransferase family 4 protein n=1 Tax=Vaginisenegalia massiliensis TaxID=2058294 RepID=UPI0019D06244|nr:glycosyltransferase family 4 protein [Vaginisenegalia massiliensis]
MKILHINSYFSTSGLFNQLYDRQVRDGLAIKVYVPIAKEFPADRLATSGDYTLVSRTFVQRDRFIFPLKHQSILKDLREQYALEDFDLIHAHSLFSNGWLAWQVSQQYQTPYVVAVRNADLRTFFQKMPWMRATGIKIMRAANQIIFISKNTYEEVFQKYIPEKYHQELKAKSQVIANGIDQYWHDHTYTNKPAVFHHPIRFVTVGKVTAGKRFLQLAEMIQNYSEAVRPAELHIVGPAWDQKIVKKFAQFPAVSYYGAHPKEELIQLYRQMDIFALLSSPETFGLVYPEAMSQGLPVIYTKNEGFDSFFANYTVGVSVDKKDQLGFNKAVDFIIKHYPQLVENALTSIEYFEWEQIHQTYCQLYEDLLTK